MAKDVQAGVPPRHRVAVVPDHPVAVVIGGSHHWKPLPSSHSFENRLLCVTIGLIYVNMVDVYTAAPDWTADDLRRAAELLFYAYRDFTAEPDRLLADYGFGRAHHRVIHFVGRNPGITVAGLLGILRITKQSLSRVLRQLVDRGFVEQRLVPQDRRRRHLYLTAAGANLEAAVSAPQQRRIAQAFDAAGADAVPAYRSILLGLVDEADRAHVADRTRAG